MESTKQDFVIRVANDIGGSSGGGDNRVAIDNIIWTAYSPSTPTISFDSSASSETETDATFNTSIPITLSNHDTDVTISVTVDGSSTAETSDYTLNTSSLVFDADETLSVSLDINDDADSDNETIVLNIAVISGTADTGTSQHTITIIDDDLPQVVITEIMYNSSGTDDEWIEIFNANGASVDISNWTIDYGSSPTTFTFPESTTIADGEYITIACGSNGDGTFNNDNPFIPDQNNLSVTNANVATTSSTNYLGNSSGTITLKSSGGSTIDTVIYDDGDVSSTDGNGPSYEIIDVTASNTSTDSNWQASAFNGGSPKKVSTTTWLGSTNNDWDISTNWSTGIPNSNSDILIPNGLINYPTASGAVTMNSVTMNSGASVIAQSTFSGTMVYNRNIPTTNWYLISSPVVGQDIDMFVATEGLASGTGNNIGLGDYNNTTPEWEYYQNGTSGTGDFISGDGRAVLLTATGNITFTGTLNTSDVDISITDATESGGNTFNLVGNPYPSFIAANNNADATNNILKVNDIDNDYLTESTLWFWNQATNSYDLVNQTSSFFIAPGQAFFVSASGNHPFSFTEAMQSHQTSDTFKSSDNRPEINLVMTNGADVRDADIYYIDGTTTGFDNGYDSSIFGGVTNEFAIYTQAVANGTGRDLGIQSLPNNDFENMVIPVGINATSGTEIIISATSTNLPTGIHVYLEDKDDNSFTLLDDSSTFQTTFTNTSNGVGRFFIHTKTQPLSTDQAELNNISIYLSDDNSLRIVGVQQGDTQVHIYSILGKQVVSTSFEGAGVNDILLPNLSMGIYMVQLKTKNGKLNKKIIIQQ